MQVDGRTEIQVKNRFNCIIKKDTQIPGITMAEQVNSILERLKV
jgi:hypothetical protein